MAPNDLYISSTLIDGYAPQEFVASLKEYSVLLNRQ